MTGDIKTRSINSSATANSSKAKPCLTQFIHSPAFGIILPWVAPIRISGADKPKPSMNKAAKPSNGLPMVETANNAPNNGAETQGDTTNADKNPAIKLPPVLPSLLSPAWLKPCIFRLIACGNRTLKRPNMYSARSIKTIAKLMRMIGFCSQPIIPKDSPNTAITAPKIP